MLIWFEKYFEHVDTFPLQRKSFKKVRVLQDNRSVIISSDTYLKNRRIGLLFLDTPVSL